MKNLSFLIVVFLLFSLNEATGQWGTNSPHIYNLNSGYVGIGTNSPGYLLHVSKNMVSPSIRIQNAGGTGGAAFEMIDNFSGADWKFKATNAGGFKIRDHASGLDVFFIEQNSAANLLYLKSGGNIGIGTTTPVSSALVDMSSTTKGFLPPRMTTAQIYAIVSPEEGLMVYNATIHKMVFFDGSEWRSTDGQIYCGSTSFTINHVAGDVAPVNKTVTYGTVSDIPGEPTKCWITSNLGADQQATAVNDATEASAGWYWEFNLMQGYKNDGSTTTPAFNLTEINENSDWIAANDPCALELGSGWRLPTSSEWTNVDAAGGWTNWSGPWNSALKLHAAGYLGADSGSLVMRGEAGFYASGTQYNNTHNYYVFLNNSFCYAGDGNKNHALSVRCLR